MCFSVSIEAAAADSETSDQSINQCEEKTRFSSLLIAAVIAVCFSVSIEAAADSETSDQALSSSPIVAVQNLHLLWKNEGLHDQR